jgi:hypothetical protein
MIHFSSIQVELTSEFLLEKLSYGTSVYPKNPYMHLHIYLHIPKE